MNDVLKKKWADVQDKLRNLNIIAGVDWDQTPDGEYITNVYVYQDVKLKPLYYRSSDLEDMIEELEVYYLLAKGKERDRRFWDGASSVWWAWVSAYVLLHTLAEILIPTVFILLMYDAGLLPEIIEAIVERLPWLAH